MWKGTIAAIEGFRTHICAKGEINCLVNRRKCNQAAEPPGGVQIGAQLKEQGISHSGYPLFLELVEGFEPSTC